MYPPHINLAKSPEDWRGIEICLQCIGRRCAYYLLHGDDKLRLEDLQLLLKRCHQALCATELVQTNLATEKREQRNFSLNARGKAAKNVTNEPRRGVKYAGIS